LFDRAIEGLYQTAQQCSQGWRVHGKRYVQALV
jgi:hypothetical protein